ncbi:hypothetical protein FB451DRAFT_1553874 [Mycena latifolia]|nr:hypothetical protein FB451DRAFT_1553874 [Mycena latifolia]
MIPQELVEAIMGEVDDYESLKSCSLVASTFCEPSQRILFRSLTLDSGDPDHRRREDPSNYREVCGLLTESPHIGPYKNFTIRLPSDRRALAGIDTQVLAKLKRVRHCTITISFICCISWTGLHPELSSALFAFISGQKFCSLTVRGLDNIPDAVLLSLITAAPRLWFNSIHVYEDSDTHSNHLILPSSINSPSIDRLILSDTTDNVCTFFQSAAHRTKLSWLSVPLEIHLRWLPEAASTLEHFRLECFLTASKTSFRVGSFHFPTFSSLRSFEIAMSFYFRNYRPHRWWLDAVSQILLSANPSTFETIIISYVNDGTFPLISPSPDPVYDPLLMELEQLLLAHPAAPCLQWWIAEEDGKTDFTGLDIVVREKMPRLHAAGRVVGQKYERNWQGEFLFSP